MSEIVYNEYYNVTTVDQIETNTAIGIRKCIDSAFDSKIKYDDATNHMQGDQVIAGIDGERNVVAAFSSTSIKTANELFPDLGLSDKLGCYFVGAAIHKDYQSRGLYHQLNRRRIKYALDNEVGYIFTRTQNPRIHEGLTHSIAIHASELGVCVDGIERIVRKHQYESGMLTGERPLARNISYDDINYENGDAAIITWHLRHISL